MMDRPSKIKCSDVGSAKGNPGGCDVVDLRVQARVVGEEDDDGSQRTEGLNVGGWRKKSRGWQVAGTGKGGWEVRKRRTRTDFAV